MVVRFYSGTGLCYSKIDADDGNVEERKREKKRRGGKIEIKECTGKSAEVSMRKARTWGLRT